MFSDSGVVLPEIDVFGPVEPVLNAPVRLDGCGNYFGTIDWFAQHIVGYFVKRPSLSTSPSLNLYYPFNSVPAH